VAATLATGSAWCGGIRLAPRLPPDRSVCDIVCGWIGDTIQLRGQNNSHEKKS